MNNIYLRFSLAIFSIYFVFGCGNDSQIKTIGNELLTIELSLNSKGVPFISKVKASDNSVEYFSDSSSGMILQNRLTKNFLQDEPVIKPLSDWKISEDSIYIKAQASVRVNDCELTMYICLVKDSPLFSVYNTVSGKTATEIKEFPVLSGELGFSDSTQTINWWKALDYTPQKELLSSDTHLSLNSHIHSSDNFNNVEGNVPYWTVETSGSFMGFSLAWCGGWRASLNGRPGILTSDIYLPENETQLKLNPGDVVKGPEISIFCSPVSDVVLARRNWLNARTNLAGKLYPTPEMGFPLIFNHWYSVEFGLSEQFFKDQVKWFDDYGFDVFMVDAGWYKNVGSWTPSVTKFRTNTFEKTFENIRSKGTMAGLWSCPQFVDAKEPLPDFIDKPGLYNPFMRAWLIDYNAIDFNKFMIQHLDTLNKIGANWWKYDQDFFSQKPRAGKLRSVNAFQDGFTAARIQFPNMIFEGCMGGGKIINEFTDRISQIHWIRDGSRTGYVHALTNIYEALGAVEFLEPQKVQRWTNRIDETEMKTPELLKLYCRSCMIGTWGISADLNKISASQRAVILNEVEYYRQLNEIKKDELIEFLYPTEYVSLVPVIFYNEGYTKAAVLFYSLFPNEKPVKFKLKTRLSQENNHEFYDVDTKSKVEVQGNVFELSLAPGQNSGIFFINEVASKIR